MKPSPLSERKETYFVPVEIGEGNLREKASRFLSFLYPCPSAEEAGSRRRELQKKFHDSSHQPYALRLGTGAEITEKASDDGEPPHSAGDPILNALRHARLTNSLLVVVRYFGGTKLGTGGLAKAFGESASMAIGNAKLKEFVPMKTIEVSMPFALEGHFRHILSKTGGAPLDETREENCRAVCEVPVDMAGKLEDALAELRERWTSTLRWKWK
ncbi:MAG TPA: YigZ family protein [Acidobacteriota bacterium]|jgi:uncharacterized YigZ family protein|nr:YigZ family protein [Acidobacteriota bacterium]HNT17446.1 YigZ family protein [Acidobacteriota bacterium]HPA26198.1 YigZ family protein [Acidobacteriota bacterium]HQO18756.1 YigZ family protein [Acidobacteriota bacterium]HQQ46881.1 YigZ family protein [Acidobacteriota bacterium]